VNDVPAGGRDLLRQTRYHDAIRDFRWAALWDLVDGDRTRLNLAHECVDRHPGDAPALRIQRADGARAEHTFAELRTWSSRFANLLEAEGVARGDRVAVMLEPSLAFYGAVFGAVKRGAIAVPLFTLFGPDALALRLDDCTPRLLLVERDGERWQARFPSLRVVAVDDRFAARLHEQSDRYAPATAPDDLAVFQYTSGTTRELPEAVRHTHRSVVTLMVAALYGVGLKPGDRYFCPSSPAWGHGLWHGTIAPLALGIAAGSYAGKFDPARLAEALHTFRVTNFAAAPTVYRMLREAGTAPPAGLEKLSFTGEPMDARTWEFVERHFGRAPCSMYGTTEVGVIVASYPGFADFVPRAGALGKAAPGWEVAVIGEDDEPLAPGELGEIAVKRRGAWFRVKDRGRMDADGYVHHAGRSDDVIISAGWTMSALEIERALLTHPDVVEAAVVGVPDALRGQIPKAYVVAKRHGAAFDAEIQAHVQARLSRHEYPRIIEVVDALPKTPAGKVNRRALRGRGDGA
jgi:acetyl-CoA synthetase